MSTNRIVGRALPLADSQAGFTYGWNDFRPIGLTFYRDGGIEAVRVPAAAASVRDVVIATGRAARADFTRVAGIGVICSAWASKQSVAGLSGSDTDGTTDGTGDSTGDGAMFVAPQDAADRQRARLVYAVDVEGIAHTFTNVAGLRHHEQKPVRDCDTILSVLSQVLAEATFTSHFFCSTGTHERVMLL